MSPPPPTPYPTQTKAPPSGGGTARHNTPFQAASGVNLGEPGGGARPLDKLNRSWYNTRVEKKEEQVAARQLHTLTKNRPYANSKTKTQ